MSVRNVGSGTITQPIVVEIHHLLGVVKLAIVKLVEVVPIVKLNLLVVKLTIVKLVEVVPIVKLPLVELLRLHCLITARLQLVRS